LRFPLFASVAEETGHSPPGGDDDEKVPPVRHGVCHEIPDPETLRRLSDGGFGGEAKEGQRTAEGSTRRPADLHAESELNVGDQLSPARSKG
jgi:hypothetical protein